MNKDYLARFKQMTHELSKYAFVEQIHFQPGAPLSEKEVSMIEQKAGSPLEDHIRNFYKQMNGVKLRWIIKPNLSLKETKALKRISTDYYLLIAESDNDPFVNINILPLDKIISHTFKADSINAKKNILRKTYTGAEVKKIIKPFDLINADYCMALVTAEGYEAPSVILLHDNCTAWEQSNTTDFGSYIEMLLATKGIVESRLKIFQNTKQESIQIQGDPAFWSKNYTPKMFKL